MKSTSTKMSLTKGSAHSDAFAEPLPSVSTVAHKIKSRTSGFSNEMPGFPSVQRAGSSQQSQSPSPSVSFGLPSALKYAGWLAGHAAGASTVAVGGRAHMPAGAL